MKKLITILLLTFLIQLGYSQEIEINGIFAPSSAMHFSNSFGYSLGYNQIIKDKNLLKFSFINYFYKETYYYKNASSFGPDSPTFKSYGSNKRFGIKLNYAFRLLDKPISKLYLGPEIGLNYFNLKEKHYSPENHTNKWYTNKIGIGILLEYRLNKIISDKISATMSVNPAITQLEVFYTMGSNVSWFVGWLNFKIGVVYNLNK